MPLFLLASYPKSGNTWMRALLTNYLSGDDEPASINALLNYDILSRTEFDERLGLSSAIMTAKEILRHRPYFHQLLAADADAVSFAKTHEAYMRLPDGAPLFASSSFAGVIYIVRSPFDVAVSLAHHERTSIDHVLDIMNNPRTGVMRSHRMGHSVFVQSWSSWSGNVLSWLDQKEMPLLVIRYEDLLADPLAVLERVVMFAGLPLNPAVLTRAVEYSRFDRLQKQEERHGFKERPSTALSFFRKGQRGDWRCTLSRQQVRQVVAAHDAAMARLGYLDG